MLQNFIDIIAAPTAALARIKQAPSFWLPMVLLIALAMSTQLGYFLHNKPGFVRDEIIQQATAGRNLTKEQTKQIEDTMSKLNINAAAGASTGAVLIIVPIVLCLMAWYLGFMAKFSFSELTFGHWLALQCWTTVPSMFGAIAVWLVLLTDTTGMVGQSDLQPLSIASLLGVKLNSPTLQQFSVLQLWSTILTVFGYQQWTKVSWLNSTIIVLAPTVIIYGAIFYFTN